MEKFTVTVANNGQEGKGIDLLTSSAIKLTSNTLALDLLLADQKSTHAADSPPRIDIVLMDIEVSRL